MASTQAFPLPDLQFIGSATAATAAVVASEFPGVSLWFFAAAQGVILVAYAAAKLPDWAGWHDGAVVDKLKLIRGLIVSVVAGNAAMLVAVEAGQARLLVMLCALAGGYLGDGVLGPLMQRAADAVQALAGGKKE